ncbi:fatty-acid amide hydrolase 2-A-like isoform X2 [Hylaeus volcanicus]|uniref:fatty-acid amide hydrolase 2-A-like isoform X2 n=1 Tax=Hylaeus volcanicus TaxID=313075 RepID=UPI0023B7842A|nr:fatty-acid amide hydrolase 2-A-like isoform X2 [Hylaeus volcanicus]
MVEERFEGAIRDAKNCDEKLKRGEVNADTLETEQPLYGVPITIKESCGVEGMSHAVGRMARRGLKATKDGAAVQILRNAGGIFLCVTNTPECCLGYNTNNVIQGVTKNPYDIRMSSGGSSGGECALIGAGASILGLGSDIVGSIRIPSFFNGIFGHKPSRGVVSSVGHYPKCENYMIEQMLTCGPIARYTEDLYLCMKLLSAKLEKPLRLDVPVDLATLRVFYVDDISGLYGTVSTSSEIKQTIKTAIKYLEQQGARVEKLQLSQEWIRFAFMIIASCFSEYDISNAIMEDTRRRMNPLLELLKSTVGSSNYESQLIVVLLLERYNTFISSSKRKYYIGLGDQCRDKLNDILDKDGVLIYPTYPHVAQLPSLLKYEIDSGAYSGIFNVLQLPATNIPMGLNDKGLPVGFQVVAGNGQDRLCLAVAKEFEKAFGGWIPPSS